MLAHAPGLVVLCADGRDEGAVDQFPVVRAVAGSAQRREGLVRDAMSPVPFNAVGGVGDSSAHADVVLHLVDGDRDGVHLQDVLDVLDAVVADADGARFAGAHEVLEGGPSLQAHFLAAFTFPRGREVRQHEVDVVEAQLLQSEVEGSGGRRVVLTAGDLGGDEVRVTWTGGGLQGSRNTLLVVVSESGVDVRVAHVQGRGDGGLCDGVVVLPSTEALQRHLDGRGDGDRRDVELRVVKRVRRRSGRGDRSGGDGGGKLHCGVGLVAGGR